MADRTSKLRKRGEAVLDAKYDGKKGSRAAIFGGGDSDDGPSDGSDAEMEAGEGETGSDEDDEDEMGDFEDLEAEEGDDSDGDGSADEEDASGSDQEEEDEDDDKEEEVAAASRRAPSSSRTKQQDERTMVSQLKQAASADVEKGRAVKKQLVRPRRFSRMTFSTTPRAHLAPFSLIPLQAFCDSLLESRIKLQKAVGAANLLPYPDQAPRYFEALGQDEVDATVRDLAGLSDELFELRQVRLAIRPSGGVTNR